MSESRIKSADDLIVAVEREQLGKLPMTPPQTSATETLPDNQEVVTSAEEQPDASEKPVPEKEKQSAKEPEPDKGSEEKTSDEPLNSDDSVDEYGNTITKDRVYTQDEVNRMIRERLARAKQPDQPVVQPQAEQPPTDGDSEDWRTQLHSEIKQVVAQEKQSEQQKAWEAKQHADQAEYEEKFTQSVAKYADFESVVAGKPITAPMMLATKSMQDPAAFIYAVCKAQPAELERIAKIPDQYVQIAEMAKLEERMKRPKITTNTPKPSRKISGDASSEMPKHSIDQLIASHAHEKIIKTRRLK